MKSFFAAIAFLSRFPVPARWAGGQRELARGAFYFPLAGLAFGAVAMGLGWAAARVFPDLLACAVMVVFLATISGGMHLDGLADAADGFFSSRSRERMLEIMRDSRSGPMGVIAIAAMLMLKLSALASIPAPWRARALLLMPLAGRCALTVTMALLPYARAEGGLASVFVQSRSRWASPWAVAVLIATGWFSLRLPGVTAAATALVMTLLFAAYAWRKIGGMTGDVLGAACELAELAPALALAAWAHWAAGGHA